MERLTFTDAEMAEIGIECPVMDYDESVDKFCDKVCDEFQYNCPFEIMAKRLKAYEDTGLTPEQLIEMDKLYSEMAVELGRYKKMQEDDGK